MVPRSLLPLILLCALSLPAGAETVQFLAFGDSITVGHGDTGVLCPTDPSAANGYLPRLRSRLASRGIDAQFSNHGKCGERTGAGLTRIEGVLDGGGDVIIIMEGTNDVSGGVGYETTVANVNEMARKAELRNVVPVVASLVPRGPEAGLNGKTNLIRLALMEDAAENGWPFADPFDALFSRIDWFELYYYDQLHPNPDGYNIVATSMTDAAEDAATASDLCGQVPPGPCVPSDTVLCLNGGRFRVETLWENFFGQGGVGHGVPQTDDTGAFYWVDPDNIEMAVKVLDGRTYNDHYWVYYGSLSNLQFSLIVTDTDTGECKEYLNPLGSFASVGDIMAFHDPLLEPPP